MCFFLVTFWRYLVWCRSILSAEEALLYFASQRSTQDEGVQVPSQKRYHHHHHHNNHNNNYYHHPSVTNQRHPVIPSQPSPPSVRSSSDSFREQLCEICRKDISRQHTIPTSRQKTAPHQQNHHQTHPTVTTTTITALMIVMILRWCGWW